ncbi:radical SAM protein [Amaricoccus sp.]|uniref:B12-binding domain-containing radical SAM protein n=1 Tax=Amaricoccus sp. TaxID=1872485 RepID=UPI001B51F297|nr:radical SAM protein [Amaricoccus sp.]MBP7002456.1 radical SAM protein [Amaricoccus sp.]
MTGSGRDSSRSVGIAPSLAEGGAPGESRRVARVLIVDLNNFATFPTLAVGLLVARLREAGHVVEVLCPLNLNVRGAQREHRDTLRDHFSRQLQHATWSPLAAARTLKGALHDWRTNRPDPVVLRETARAIEARRPDVVLLSAYLQHYPSVAEIGGIARRAGVPLVVGGPMFNLPEVADAWRELPGVTAIVGAEADLDVAGLASDAVAGAGEGLLDHPGVTLSDGRRSAAARPLRPLDATPIPDFSDFPWSLYPFRVVPVMTGRGCQWDRCVFCSDVISANGRSFRTRSVDRVMEELAVQARRHDTASFIFLDLKLNSNPAMFRGISDRIRSVVPGAEWIGTVHVDQRRDNGLSLPDLRAAVGSGMRRISFGLESGSQRLLDAMDKGASVETNSEFIRNAHQAGLSVRATMFRGFPGETAEDLDATAAFLERHEPFMDRVRFKALTVNESTPLFHSIAEGRHGGMRITAVESRRARVATTDGVAGGRAYRKALARVLNRVFAINRREVRVEARAFDGLM